MAANNLSVLPIWKKGASLADRLEEMACYARAKPERFEKFVMVFVETMPSGRWKVRTMDYGCNNVAEEIGFYEMGKQERYKESEA